MKKIPMPVVITVTIILAIAGIAAGWFKYQTRDMFTLRTGPIGGGITAVKGRIANFYLLKVGERYVAFDAGEGVDLVRTGLQMLGIDPKQVAAVFLTHSDGDHTGGLPLFTQATVYLSKDEVPLITRSVPRHLLGLSHYNTLSVSSCKTLGDGDSVVIDSVVIQGIATPGHTPGSMSYLVNGTLFTGDLCIIKNGYLHPMIKLFTENMALDGESIRKISSLPGIKRICTAHSGFTTDVGKALGR